MYEVRCIDVMLFDDGTKEDRCANGEILSLRALILANRNPLMPFVIGRCNCVRVSSQGLDNKRVSRCLVNVGS